MVFIRSADAAHPSRAIANSDHGHDTFDTRIDCGDPNDRGPAIARAIQTESPWFDFRTLGQKSERGLHVGNAAMGRQPALRSLAVAPAFVVECQDDVAGSTEVARDLGQIEIPHSCVSVAKDDAGTLLRFSKFSGQIQITGEFETFAIEAYSLCH